MTFKLLEKMVDKKRQHYVPRFYLKNFSTNSEGKSIGVYNVDRYKFIPRGSLKEQAYKNYFYGEDDEIEDSLSTIESIAASAIKNILAKRTMPEKLTSEYYSLLAFTALQWARTPYAADEAKEIIEKSLESTVERDKSYKIVLDEFKSRLENAPLYLLRNVPKLIPCISDLNIILLINQTNIPFITSDNPVVLYNQFLEKRREYYCNTSFESKGLQIFFPLSPELCLIFFDKDVYRFSNALNRTIKLAKQQDLNALNQLQCINSYTNIYFNENVSNDYITYIFRKVKKWRRDSKFRHIESPPRKGPDGGIRILQVNHKNDIKINLYLSFISIKKSARGFKIGDKALIVRNEQLFKQREYLTALERTQYQPTRIGDFIVDYNGIRKIK